MRTAGKAAFWELVPAVPALLFLAAAFLCGCAKSPEKGPEGGSGEGAKPVSIGVFIPGVVSGSPSYEMLARGVKRAVDEGGRPAELTVIEGGFNQAEWEAKLTALTASANYDLLVSSNPSLPAIVASVSAKFPGQRFLLLDGELEGNPGVYSLRYNQREQSYMAGHIAALTVREMMEQNRERWKPRVGLVAAQEYPVMNDVIKPGYLEGARAVDPGFTLDFRVLGNWYDAARAAELSAGMIREGTAVILCIAGGANEGVVQAAGEGGAKTVWWDIAGYGIRPGTVIGSAILRQDRAAYEKTRLFLEGRLPFGKAEIAGIAEGYVDFADDDPLYLSAVSPPVRERQALLLARLRSGELRLP
jgi:simple sugar transport system substrate-binding protein